MNPKQLKYVTNIIYNNHIYLHLNLYLNYRKQKKNF